MAFSPSPTLYPSTSLYPEAGLHVLVTPGTVKPPLDLHAELVAPDGTRHRWGSERADPGERPQQVGFASKRFEGFERGSASLSRPVGRDWPDLGLFDGITLVGYDGSVAYEGMLGQVPRSTPHGIGVEATGWMAHARHRKCRPFYVDRDAARWGEAPLWRRAEIAAAGLPQGKIQAAAQQSGLVWDFPNESLGTDERTELWFEAPPGVGVYKLGYEAVHLGTTSNVEAATLFATDSAAATSTYDTATLTADDTVRYATPANPRRRFMLRAAINATLTPAAGTQRRFGPPAVYGTDGEALPQAAFTDASGAVLDPHGFYVSDMVADICSRWCPRLDPSGVQATTWPVPQAAWHDRIDPYDAWLDLNKYHLWELAVWDDRTLHYGPSDLTDYDWQVRTTDPEVRVHLQGDSIDHLKNYAVVQFTNIRTGEVDEVNPTTHSELRDTDVEHPGNRWGLDLELGVELSSPTDPDSAAQIGRALLAENNQPRATGTITFKGHIRDRAGHWQQGWKVRAGETVAITDWPNNRPRLIGEVEWDHTTKTGTIAVDSTLRRVDAFLDRYGTALRAAGLGG